LEKITIAYLQGCLGDATYNRLHKTHRISQNNLEWLEKIKKLLYGLGSKAWIYKEGKTRNVYVLETTSKLLSMRFDPDQLASQDERKAYVRGYFDAEGGTSRSDKVRFYLQFAEKNKNRVEKVRGLLESLGINCGAIHIPSVTKDPQYWRFYVKADCYDRFISVIGSWHPRKQKLFSQRVKI